MFGMGVGLMSSSRSVEYGSAEVTFALRVGEKRNIAVEFVA